MKQTTFASTGFELVTKRTRKREFLEEMNLVVPWTKLTALIQPFVHAGKTGRLPFPIATMLRIHFMQQWFGLSDPAMEEINARGEMPIIVRQVKYLNNIVEQDHRAVKRVTKPMLNFKSFRSAKCVLTGIKLMNMIRKGQLLLQGCIKLSFAVQFYALAGQIRLVLGTGTRPSKITFISGRIQV